MTPLDIKSRRQFYPMDCARGTGVISILIGRTGDKTTVPSSRYCEGGIA